MFQKRPTFWYNYKSEVKLIKSKFKKKGRFKFKKEDNLNYKFRRNRYIQAREVRVVTEEGNLGVMPLQDALDLARSKELDLVEISPGVQPPVCKIIDWSKFKYEYSKKNRENKSNPIKLKEMQFMPMIDGGDLEHKTKKIRKFLKDKNKVKITIKYKRSRYKLDYNAYKNTLNQVLELLSDVSVVDAMPKQEGRNMYAIIRPK